jgi:hypothetical protein
VKSISHHIDAQEFTEERNMQSGIFNTLHRRRVTIMTGLLAAICVMALAETAHAIPAFSRKYRTSCITCHTVYPKLNDTGEAFRRNGYQFPTGDDILVKEEPIPFGREMDKDSWPDSLWPSDLPAVPPVFARVQLRNIINTDPAEDGLKWDMQLPHELGVGGAGTFGKDVSAWWQFAIEPEEEEVSVERVFVQFSNLFAWSDEDDEDGMRTGNRFLTLPKHALNLRIGKLEPQVLAHVFSQHARVGISRPLPNRQRIGENLFRIEPTQSAVELHGIIKQEWSYAVGYANGGAVSGGPVEDNNSKDVYFRIAHKWFGFPMDGVMGQSEPYEFRGQSPDGEYEEFEDYEYAPGGLDFWRSVAFETGVFGWWGKSQIPLFMADTRGDAFRRIGADFRLQWHDLDVYGLGYLGQENFAGLNDGVDLGREEFYSYLIQSDYMVKPWWLGFVRYEQTIFREGARAGQEQARVVPGMVFLIRQNMKLQTEWVLDTTGKDTGGPQATDQLLVQLDFAY